MTAAERMIHKKLFDEAQQRQQLAALIQQQRLMNNPGLGALGGIGARDSSRFVWCAPSIIHEIPGPILALRGWVGFTRSDYTQTWEKGLFPVGWSNVKWKPREAPRAENFPGPEGGYWGLRFREDIPSCATIAGVVAMWGEIIPHEKGFRAEYAYPVVIWPNNREDQVKSPMPGFPMADTHYSDIEEIAEEIAEEYGVKWLKRPPWEDEPDG